MNNNRRRNFRSRQKNNFRRRNGSIGGSNNSNNFNSNQNSQANPSTNSSMFMNTGNQITEKDVGITLSVTPRINDESRITLVVDATVEALLSAAPEADPERRVERVILKGDLPSPIDPPSGCVFRTRCQYAKSECATNVPPLREIAPGHRSACIRNELI